MREWILEFYTIMGTALFVMGVIQMLPWFRRRAVERGFSGWIGIPAILAGIGLITVIASRTGVL